MTKSIPLELPSSAKNYGSNFERITPLRFIEDGAFVVLDTVDRNVATPKRRSLILSREEAHYLHTQLAALLEGR